MNRFTLFTVLRYSDHRILYYLRSWEGWPLLGRAFVQKGFSLSSFFGKCFRDFLGFMAAVVVCPNYLLTRRAPGKNTLGVFLVSNSCLLLNLINSSSFDVSLGKIKAPFIAISKLFVVVDQSWIGIWNMLWQPASVSFAVFIIVVFIVGLVQLVGLYFFGAASEFPNYRGESVFTRLLRKRTERISDIWIEEWFEPSFWLLLGWTGLTFMNENAISITFIIMGVLQWILEALDRNYRRNCK